MITETTGLHDYKQCYKQHHHKVITQANEHNTFLATAGVRQLEESVIITIF